MFTHSERNLGGATRYSRWIIFVCAAPIALAATAAHSICVSSDGELQAALTVAETIPQTIELVRGTYGLSFDIQIADGSSLRGGYGAGCTSRNIELGNTVMTNDGNLAALGSLTIEGLTWHAPFAIVHDDSISGEVPAGSEVLVRRSAFVDGNSGGFYFEWFADDDDVTIRIVDTVVANNAHGGITIIVLDDQSLSVELVNDTVVDNTQSDGFYAQIAGTGTTVYAYNSIFYGNNGSGAHDFGSDSNFIVLVDNVIGTHSYPSPLFPPIGTQTGNPRLDGNYRPVESPPSPVIDSGTAQARGGLPSSDLSGRARVVGTQPDRGAFESSVDDSFLQSVSNTSDSGVGSLRSAIAGANAHGSGLITFDLGSGCGPHVITLSSPLPSVTVPLIVNGYSQAGSAANDLDVGDDATFCVILESGDASVTKALQVGTGAGDGVSLFAEGLAFSGFSEAGIALGSGSGHLIVGNRFGGTASGHALLPNGQGIRLDAAAHDSTIGGEDPAQRNILSGSTGSGIAMFGSLSGSAPVGTYNDQIVGNLIGVGWTGDASGHFTNLGNGTRGIYLAGHDNDISGNWIGDNLQAGILVDAGGARTNAIEHNHIGFRYQTNHGNGAAGIHMQGDAGDAPTANVVRYNTIAENTDEGVWIGIGRENRTRHNSIYGNGGLGIDLDAPGVLANDNDGGSQSPDFANRGLNYPVLTAALGGRTSGTFSGSLESALGDYRIDFYQTLGGCDPNDNRQGEFWIGTATVSITQAAVGGDGSASIDAHLHSGDFASLVSGAGVTATSTDSVGNTSELSACVPYVDDTIFANGFEQVL